MKLDTSRIHKDILKRLYKMEKPQKYLTEEVGISRSTFWRIGEGKDITVSTFLKIITWLEKDLKYYIIN